MTEEERQDELIADFSNRFAPSISNPIELDDRLAEARSVYNDEFGESEDFDDKLKEQRRIWFDFNNWDNNLKLEDFNFEPVDDSSQETIEAWEDRQLDRIKELPSGFLYEQQIKQKIGEAATQLVRNRFSEGEDQNVFDEFVLDPAKRFGEAVGVGFVGVVDREGDKIAAVQRFLKTDPQNDGKPLSLLAGGFGSAVPSLVAGAVGAVGTAVATGNPITGLAGGGIGFTVGSAGFSLATRANEAYRTTIALTNNKEKAEDSFIGQIPAAGVDVFSDLVVTRFAAPLAGLRKSSRMAAMAKEIKTAQNYADKIKVIKKYDRDIVAAGLEGSLGEAVAEPLGDLVSAYGLDEEIRDGKVQEAIDGAFKSAALGFIIGGTISGTLGAVVTDGNMKVIERAQRAGLKLDDVVDTETGVMKSFDDVEAVIESAEKARAEVTKGENIESATSNQSTEEIRQRADENFENNNDEVIGGIDSLRTNKPRFNEEGDTTDTQPTDVTEESGSSETDGTPRVEEEGVTDLPSAPDTEATTGTVEPPATTTPTAQEVQAAKTEVVQAINSTRSLDSITVTPAVKQAVNEVVVETLGQQGTTEATAAITPVVEAAVVSQTLPEGVNAQQVTNDVVTNDVVRNSLVAITETITRDPELSIQEAVETTVFQDGQIDPAIIEKSVANVQGAPVATSQATPTPEPQRKGAITGTEKRSPIKFTDPSTTTIAETDTNVETSTTTSAEPKSYQSFLKGRNNGKDVKIVEPAGKGAKALVKTVTDISGAKVAFFKGDSVSADGYYHTPSNTILVNSNLSKNRSMEVILGHEMAHAIQVGNPELWKDIVGRLDNIGLDAHRLFKYRDDFLQKYDRDQWFTEVIADMVGQSFRDPTMMREIRRVLGSDTLMDRFMRFLQPIMTKIRDALKIDARAALKDNDRDALGILEDSVAGIEAITRMLETHVMHGSRKHVVTGVPYATMENDRRIRVLWKERGSDFPATEAFSSEKADQPLIPSEAMVSLQKKNSFEIADAALRKVKEFKAVMSGKATIEKTKALIKLYSSDTGADSAIEKIADELQKEIGIYTGQADGVAVAVFARLVEMRVRESSKADFNESEKLYLIYQNTLMGGSSVTVNRNSEKLSQAGQMLSHASGWRGETAMGPLEMENAALEKVKSAIAAPENMRGAIVSAVADPDGGVVGATGKKEINAEVARTIAEDSDPDLADARALGLEFLKVRRIFLGKIYSDLKGETSEAQASEKEGQTLTDKEQFLGFLEEQIRDIEKAEKSSNVSEMFATINKVDNELLNVKLKGVFRDADVAKKAAEIKKNTRKNNKKLQKTTTDLLVEQRLRARKSAASRKANKTKEDKARDAAIAALDKVSEKLGASATAEDIDAVADELMDRGWFKTTTKESVVELLTGDVEQARAKQEAAAQTAERNEQLRSEAIRDSYFTSFDKKKSSPQTLGDLKHKDISKRIIGGESGQLETEFVDLLVADGVSRADAQLILEGVIAERELKKQADSLKARDKAVKQIEQREQRAENKEIKDAERKTNSVFNYYAKLFDDSSPAPKPKSEDLSHADISKRIIGGESGQLETEFVDLLIADGVSRADAQLILEGVIAEREIKKGKDGEKAREKFLKNLEKNRQARIKTIDKLADSIETRLPFADRVLNGIAEAGIDLLQWSDMTNSSKLNIARKITDKLPNSKDIIQSVSALQDIVDIVDAESRGQTTRDKTLKSLADVASSARPTRQSFFKFFSDWLEGSQLYVNGEALAVRGPLGAEFKVEKPGDMIELINQWLKENSKDERFAAVMRQELKTNEEITDKDIAKVANKLLAKYIQVVSDVSAKKADELQTKLQSGPGTGKLSLPDLANIIKLSVLDQSLNPVAAIAITKGQEFNISLATQIKLVDLFNRFEAINSEANAWVPDNPALQKIRNQIGDLLQAEVPQIRLPWATALRASIFAKMFSSTGTLSIPVISGVFNLASDHYINAVKIVSELKTSKVSAVETLDHTFGVLMTSLGIKYKNFNDLGDLTFKRSNPLSDFMDGFMGRSASNVVASEVANGQAQDDFNQFGDPLAQQIRVARKLRQRIKEKREAGEIVDNKEAMSALNETLKIGVTWTNIVFRVMAGGDNLINGISRRTAVHFQAFDKISDGTVSKQSFNDALVHSAQIANHKMEYYRKELALAGVDPKEIEAIARATVNNEMEADFLMALRDDSGEVLEDARSMMMHADIGARSASGTTRETVGFAGILTNRVREKLIPKAVGDVKADGSTQGFTEKILRDAFQIVSAVTPVLSTATTAFDALTPFMPGFGALHVLMASKGRKLDPENVKTFIEQWKVSAAKLADTDANYKRMHIKMHTGIVAFMAATLLAGGEEDDEDLVQVFLDYPELEEQEKRNRWERDGRIKPYMLRLNIGGIRSDFHMGRGVNAQMLFPLVWGQRLKEAVNAENEDLKDAKRNLTNLATEMSSDMFDIGLPFVREVGNVTADKSGIYGVERKLRSLQRNLLDPGLPGPSNDILRAIEGSTQASGEANIFDNLPTVRFISSILDINPGAPDGVGARLNENGRPVRSTGIDKLSFIGIPWNLSSQPKKAANMTPSEVKLDDLHRRANYVSSTNRSFRSFIKSVEFVSPENKSTIAKSFGLDADASWASIREAYAVALNRFVATEVIANMNTPIKKGSPKTINNTLKAVKIARDKMTGTSGEVDFAKAQENMGIAISTIESKAKQRFTRKMELSIPEANRRGKEKEENDLLLRLLAEEFQAPSSTQEAASTP